MNTTHALNIVALGFPFQSGDVVLLTDKEHNSNLLPWLKLQKAGRIKIDFTVSNDRDEFDLDAFEHKMKNNRVRLVSMTYTSNITGYTIPAREIIKIAHQYGALVLSMLPRPRPIKGLTFRAWTSIFWPFRFIKCVGHEG